MEHWELAARESVREVIAHYNLAGDRGWLDDMLALFTDDATLTIDGTEHVGRDAIRAVFTQAKGPHPELIRHHVATLKIDVQDADHASSRCYFQVLTMRGLDHWGRYTDRFVRQGDRWLFRQRSVRVDGATPGGWAALRGHAQRTERGFEKGADAEQPGRHDVP
jgi:uncharacterized protein (TIGR02246 family)